MKKAAVVLGLFVCFVLASQASASAGTWGSLKGKFRGARNYVSGKWHSARSSFWKSRAGGWGNTAKSSFWGGVRGIGSRFGRKAAPRNFLLYKRVTRTPVSINGRPISSPLSKYGYRNYKPLK